jgi:hypothetical protein
MRRGWADGGRAWPDRRQSIPAAGFSEHRDHAGLQMPIDSTRTWIGKHLGPVGTMLVYASVTT